MSRLFTVACLAVAALAVAGASQAATISYRFEATTGNNPANVAAGEEQLRVAVGKFSTADAADFSFTADGGDDPQPLSVTEIAILDASGIFHMDQHTLIGGIGSDWSFSLDPDAAPGWSVFRSDGPDRIGNGLGHDDLGLTLHLPLQGVNLGGVTGMELVHTMLEGSDPGIGSMPVLLTVEGFADGGQEQFELVPEAVPEPAFGALAAAALAFGARARWAAAR